MSEKLKPNVLLETDTLDNVFYYDNQFPPVQPGEARYIVVRHGKIEQRHEISELNAADWIILNALFPHGPNEVC